MKIAVVSLNKQGDAIAENIKSYLAVDVFSKRQIKGFDIKKLSERLMEEYKGIIFISSIGIAVRAIAPYIKGKDKDPAVVVVDCVGKYAVSLLSGHLGGANDLAAKVARVISAEPVITTATDMLGVTAPDTLAKEHGLGIYDLRTAKDIAALLVDGKKVAFIDEQRKIQLPKGYTEEHEGAEGAVIVTNRMPVSVENQASLIKIPKLYLIRKNVILGIGCRKDYSQEKMINTVLRILEQHNIHWKAISTIATIDLKKEERAILELSSFLEAELKTFSEKEIKKVQHNYPGSDFVEKSVGVRAVCEPCVELMGGTLLTEKICCDGMTICIGENI